MDAEYDDVVQAIREIHQIVNKFREKYSYLKQKPVTNVDNKGKALRILSSVERIVKHYNKNNAERKLQSLIRMLGKEIVK